MRSKKIISLYLLSLVFISGCTTSKNVVERPASQTDSYASSENAEKTKPTNTQVNYAMAGLEVDNNAVSSTGAKTEAAKPAGPGVPTQPKSMEYNPNKHYFAALVTNKGNIIIALNFGQTPITVKNFLDLAQKQFYNKTIFHRVIKGFMIQGGDPQGNGTGGPGYKFDDEPFIGDYARGTVAMANAGPNTNGSQFFIMQADQNLPKNYVIFGKVLKGMDVVDAIASAPVTTNMGGEQSRPVEPVVIDHVELLEE